MSFSPLLAIDELAENQNQKHITVNEAIAALEAATQANTPVVFVANADLVLSEDQITRNVMFITSGNTATVNLKIPNKIQTVVDLARLFIVKNESGFDVVVRTTDAVVGTTVLVPGGGQALIYGKGKNFYALVGGSSGGSSSGTTFGVGLFVPGLQPEDIEVLRYVFLEGVIFAADFSGSRGSLAVNPTATMAYTIKKNGTTAGSISISTSGVYTFTSVGALTVSFAVGDILTIVSPVTQDVTGEAVHINLKGVRV